MEGQDLSFLMDTEDRFQEGANPWRAESPIGQRGREASNFPYQVGLHQEGVSNRHASVFGPLLFPGHHEARKIQIILMGRRVGAMIKAEFTVVTFLFDPGKILPGEFGHVAFVIVQPVDKRREGRTQVETSAASVANVKNPNRFFF